MLGTDKQLQSGCLLKIKKGFLILFDNSKPDLNGEIFLPSLNRHVIIVEEETYVMFLEIPKTCNYTLFKIMINNQIKFIYPDSVKEIINESISND